jgi:hypothetical protein
MTKRYYINGVEINFRPGDPTKAPKRRAMRIEPRPKGWNKREEKKP